MRSAVGTRVAGFAAGWAATDRGSVRSTVLGAGRLGGCRRLKRWQVIEGEGPAAGHCSRMVPLGSGLCLRLRWKGRRAVIWVCRSALVSISRTCLSSRLVVAVAARCGVSGQAREPSISRAPWWVPWMPRCSVLYPVGVVASARRREGRC